MKNNTFSSCKTDYQLHAKNVIKFVLCSAFGLGAFMLPLKVFEGLTAVSALSNYLTHQFDIFLNFFIFIIILFATVFGICDRFLPPTLSHPLLIFIRKSFSTSNMFLLTRIISLVIILAITFQWNIEMITSKETSGNMLSLAKSLITIAIALSYVLPFLTNSGIMEFFGVLTENFIRPLFKVSGVASLDLATSWFGASNSEVILCREKYHKGYYSSRETAVIMCNFSLVSVSFVYIVCQAAHLEKYFSMIFIVACLISFILAIIMPRIPPLAALEDTYYHKKVNFDNTPPKGINRFTWGLLQGSNRASKFQVKEVIGDGTKVMTSIWIGLVPTVIAWGTIGLIIVYYTDIFEYLSYPIGIVFQFLSIEKPFLAASTLLIGYVDMFIPALVITDVASIQTRFIVVMMSLVQMIYLTEVGAIILQSNIGIDFKTLTLIFLERTILAFPIIYLLAILFF